MKPSDYPAHNFNRFCVLRTAGVDLTKDEKRVQDELHDKRIKVRWHVLSKHVQVWYDAPSGAYCVFTIEENYSAARVIKKLRALQKSPKELADVYTADVERRAQSTKDKTRGLAEEMTYQTRKFAVGKVTSTTGGKSKLEL